MAVDQMLETGQEVEGRTLDALFLDVVDHGLQLRLWVFSKDGWHPGSHVADVVRLDPKSLEKSNLQPYGIKSMNPELYTLQYSSCHGHRTLHGMSPDHIRCRGLLTTASTRDTLVSNSSL